MADYPALDKTWQYSVNQALAVQSTALAASQLLLYSIVQSLTGFASHAWQIRGSSNGTTASLLALTAAGPGTGWSGTTQVVWSASAGVAHSWIVLRQTGLGSDHPEILISCDTTTFGNSVAIWISPSAGFTSASPSTTADPTATDQIQLSAGGSTTLQFGSTNTTAANALHVEMSNDGACTRMWVYSGGTFQAMWIIDVAKNPVSGWSIPWFMLPMYSGNIPASNNVTDTNTSYAIGGYTVPIKFWWTAESANGSLVTVAYNHANDLNSEYPMLPIGLWASPASGFANPGRAGRHGMIYDAWWGCAVLAAGQTYAGAAASAYVQAVGSLILPWSGAATMNTS